MCADVEGGRLTSNSGKVKDAKVKKRVLSCYTQKPEMGVEVSGNGYVHINRLRPSGQEYFKPLVIEMIPAK